MPTKRKPTPDKMRFEVFKRDKFTCQYCGQKAPDVILRCDHVIPVCEGGKTVLVNLVTSCIDCNSGKGGRLLSDESAVVKARKAAEISEEKRQQVEMLAEWHLSLSGGDHEVNAVAKSFEKLTNIQLSDTGLKKVRTVLRKYGFDRVMRSLITACDKYEPEEVADKLGPICYYSHLEDNDPAESELAKAFFKLRYELSTSNACWYTKDLMRRARDSGISIAAQVEWAKQHCNSFSQFNDDLAKALEQPSPPKPKAVRRDPGPPPPEDLFG